MYCRLHRIFEISTEPANFSAFFASLTRREKSVANFFFLALKIFLLFRRRFSRVFLKTRS